MTSVIGREEYERLRAKTKAYESARKTFDPKKYQRGGGYTPADVAKIEKMAGGKDATNDEKAKLEVYEFVNDPPQRYFAYYNKELTEIRGWTGLKLGTIVARGGEYKSPLGDKRVNVKIQGINGVLYSGTCFLSAGDYCRIKAVKSSRLNPLTETEQWVVREQAAKEMAERTNTREQRAYMRGRAYGRLATVSDFGPQPVRQAVALERAQAFMSWPNWRPKSNPLLMTVMGNPGHDYQDVYEAAQRVGYTVADAATLASNYQRGGRLPTIVAAQLRSPLRYNCNPAACENPQHRHNPRSRTPYTHARALLREFVTPLEEGGPEYSSDYASNFADRARIAIRRRIGSTPQEIAFLKEFVNHEWNPDYFEDFAFRVSRFLGYRDNPRASRGRYVHERLASPGAFQRGSFRTLRRGGHRIVVGRPRGSTKTRAQSILHPTKNPFEFQLGPERIKAEMSRRGANKQEIKEAILRLDGLTVKAPGPHYLSDFLWDQLLQIRMQMKGKNPAGEDVRRQWTVWPKTKKQLYIPAFEGTFKQALEWAKGYAARHKVEVELWETDPKNYRVMNWHKEKWAIVRPHGGYEIVKGRKNPGRFTVGRGRTERKLSESQARRIMRNPKAGRRRKVTMSLAAFSRMLKAKRDPKLWAAFAKKIAAYKKWTHGSLPKNVTIETVDVPGVSGIWLTYDAGKAPETTYVMPRGSKRKGAWVHEWETMPDLKNDPEAGIMLTKLRGKSRITDFLHK